MAKVRIVTDSTADLPEELAELFGITIVPLKVFIDGQSFLDRVNLSPTAFYVRLAASKELPKTSQPSPIEFADYYRPLIEEGAEIVSLHISEQLSGTAQSAQLAKTTILKYEQLEVIDTRMVSVVLGMVTLAAARAAEAGCTKNEILELVQSIANDHSVCFMVDTLEYLQRGGRIGKAQAFLGTLLNVKPLCTVSPDGEVAPVEKVRGRKKAINRMIRLIAEQNKDSGPLFCFLVHGDDEAGLSYLHDLATAELNIKEIYHSQLGPVVGTHVGPGLLGLSVCPYKYML